MKIVAVETHCQGMGHELCQFIITHQNNIKKYVPQSYPINLLIATTSVSNLIRVSRIKVM